MTRHVDAYRIEWDEQFRTYVDPVLLARGRGVSPRPEGDYRLDERHPAIIVRHPSRNDNARTLIASLLPKQGVLHNKGYVHAVRHEAIPHPVDVLALLGFVNSLTCDWWARRFVDRHVTAPVVNNLRLPEWDEVERARVATIVSALLRLRDPDLNPCVDLMPAEPALAGLSEIALLADVEVASLAGMGVDRTAFDVILEDFSHNGCPPELRRAITERLEA